MNPTDDTRGFPRLPFNPTPPPDLIAQAMSGAKEDPAEAMRRVVALIVQHMGLQQRNNDFSARFWGTADVSEENSEHWQYLRNADFALGVTASGAFKWVNNAALQAAALTTSMPYGVPRGITVQDQSAAKNWLQQSCSATGNTWYVADGWVKRTGGTTAGIDIVENSGSASARTHSVYFPNETNNPWRRLGDHRNPAGLTFKTYKGTTKLTFRTVVAANGSGQFAQVMLEKGRRRHPWRLHFMERGNLITSLKTAGSASWTGNIRLSASGGAIVRQVATKTFVYGTRHTATLPVRVSATGAVGTAATLSRSDHRHRGVPYMDTAGSASASGPIRLSGSGAVTIRQKAGPPRTFVIRAAAGASASSTTPNPVSAAGAVGTGTTYARADHVHRGVKAIKYGATSNDGTVSVSSSGTATSMGLAWSGAKLKIGFPKAASATPAASSTSGTVGTGTLWARTDHRHRGVKALRIRGAQGSASGTVRISQSSNVTIRRSGTTVIVGAAGGSGYTTGCRVYNDANISIAYNTWTSLTFNQERYDTDTMHSTVSNTGRITFTTAGKYHVSGHAYWASNTTGIRGIRVLLNGLTIIANNFYDSTVNTGNMATLISTLYNFAATDYVELQVYQSITSTGALNIEVQSNYSPEFAASRVG